MGKLIMILIVLCSGCSKEGEIVKLADNVCGDNLKTYQFRQGSSSWDWDITITCTVSEK